MRQEASGLDPDGRSLGLYPYRTSSSLVASGVRQAQNAIDKYIERQSSKRRLSATEDEVSIGIRHTRAQQTDSVTTDNPEDTAVAPEVDEVTVNMDTVNENLDASLNHSE